MIKRNVQNQKSGDNSINLQGRDITVYTGITYSEAKDIALDVFKNNFPLVTTVLRGNAIRTLLRLVTKRETK